METLPPEPQQDAEVLRLIGQNKRLTTDRDYWKRLALSRATSDEEMQEFLGFIEAQIEPQLPVPRPRARKVGRVPVENLAIITDIHDGEIVRADSTNGLAVYSPSIAEERVGQATDEIIEYGLSEKSKKLVLGLLGDNISGMIHDDLERSNAEMTVAQTLHMGDVLTESIQRFAAAFPEVEVDGRSGNHGRTYRPMFFNRKQEENWDNVLYRILEYRLANQKNVRFLTNKSFWNIIDVGNRKFLHMHGDTIKHANSMSLPWYSMFKELLKWMAMRETGGVPWFDDMNIGHYHQNVTIQMGRSALRGTLSVKGEDDYSYAGSRIPAPPGARVLSVAEGRVLHDHVIDLTPSKPMSD